MLQGFTRGLYGGARTLGEAIDGAYDVLTEHPASARDMFAIYNLLGDPATRLKDRNEQPLIIPPAGDAGADDPAPPMGDAGVAVDLGAGGTPTTGSMGGGACTASVHPGQGTTLFFVALALLGLRVRRRVR
jgi:hypothetical protein